MLLVSLSCTAVSGSGNARQFNRQRVEASIHGGRDRIDNRYCQVTLELPGAGPEAEIGAHDHESYYAFDIWYNNTSGITPNVLTGDMHVINKGNFSIMDWFGGNLYPRFTNLQTQIKHLYCGDDPKQYSDVVKQFVTTQLSHFF